jgi:hypothetical protein
MEHPLRFATINPRGSAVAAIAAIVLAACNSGAGASGDADDDLSLSITSPADGAEVSVPFDVELESSVPLGDPETGNHHAHLYFDTDISSEDYELVYGTSVQVARDLAPGEHTIVASLRNADHSDAGPSQEITVTVVAGDGSSSESSDESSSPPPSSDDGGIDY